MTGFGALLTVDLGNTSAKLRLWAVLRPRDRAADRRPELLATASAPAQSVLERALRSVLEGAPEGTAGVLSSVAAPELEQRVAGALSEALGPGWLGVPEPGIDNTCRDPHTVGSDRLFAARGAVACVGGSALVVDAGTALTVDAVELAGGGARPRFLGGAIAPGPELLASSMAAGAARLPRIEPRGGVPALGRDTPSALASGVFFGLRGAAAELVHRIGAESGLGPVPIAVTGGSRGLLLEPPFVERGVRQLLDLPDLVHVGLFEAALDVAGGGSGAGRGQIWSVR